MARSLRDRVLGASDPAATAGPALARAVRHGSEALAVTSLLELGTRPEDDARLFVEARLADPRVAVRKAAARALGRRADPRSATALSQRVPGLPDTDELALHLAAARVRCAADPVAARAVETAALDARDRRTFWTEGGVRRVALDVPPLVERLGIELDGPAPGFDALAAQLRTAGRREQHVIFNAIGLAGDPRGLPLLVDALRATDVDPGRGFTQRRLAATAIGRIGLRASGAVLTQALRDEALDFEGRPGAGMGIQYPVRTNLLWALGELADPTHIPTLISYLANTSGSAFGGFYLAAMDGLWKAGEAATGPLRAVLAAGPETAAAHALGVLVARGVDPTPWRSDPRAGVARIAAAAIAAAATAAPIAAPGAGTTAR